MLPSGSGAEARLQAVAGNPDGAPEDQWSRVSPDPQPLAE